MTSVLVDRDSPVWTLTMNRPERRNALDLDDRRELLGALAEASSAADCRAIVLTGTGAVFCAGGDIRSMSPDPELARVRLDVVADLARALVHSPKPVVAAVEGGAFGLGLSLAAAADTGLSWSLAQRVGPGRAKELMLFATELSAASAQHLGLVSEVTEPGDALRLARVRAGTLAAASPGMVAATKRIFAQPGQDLDSVLAAETEAQLELLAGADFAARRQAFLERRSSQGGAS